MTEKNSKNKNAPEQRLLLRHAILLQLSAAWPASLALPTLGQGVRLAGFKKTDAELEGELEYLCEKGFASRRASELSAAYSRWRLSAAGRDYLEAHFIL